jgi:hypothetical protein
MRLLMIAAILGIIIIGFFQGPFFDTAMAAIKSILPS